MALPEDKTAISITIDGNINNLLETYAKEYGIPKSKFCHNIIYSCLRDLKIIHKTGFLTAGKMLHTFFETFSDKDTDSSSFAIKDDLPPTTISVIIDTDVKATLQEYADYFDLPVKTLARNAIYLGLDNFQVLERFGFVKLSKYSRAFRCFVKSYIDET